MAKVAVITGATSGIGEALAYELADRGWELGLTGRRSERLAQVKAKIAERHSERKVEVRTLDVIDTMAVATTMAELSRSLGGLNLVIANAGIGGSRKIGSDDFETDSRIIQTNLIGAMATVDAGVAVMRDSGGGQVVGISSVAGFRGLPGSAAYSASKAGLTAYLDAVRAEVAHMGIGVTTISPGFIDTPINQHARSRPFVITVESGAARIVDRIERHAIHATVPAWPWSVVGFVMRNTPDFLWPRLAGKRPDKHRKGLDG